MDCRTAFSPRGPNSGPGGSVGSAEGTQREPDICQGAVGYSGAAVVELGDFPVAETFSGAVVQEVLNFSDSMLGYFGQIRALGEELADQAIGVLVRTALPGTVGIARLVNAS